MFLLALAACNGQEKSPDVSSEENPTCPYRFPWSNTLPAVMVSQGANDLANKSHRAGTYEQYAADFRLPEGTPVLASREGVLSAFHDGEILHGNDKSFARYGNYVVIDHGDGQVTFYQHLKSTVFTEGDIGKKIVAGQQIGLSGNTGWSTGAHLHFQVQTRKEGFGQSIPFCFAELEGGVLEAGKSYVSKNQIVQVLGMQVTAESNGTDWSQLSGVWEGETSGPVPLPMEDRSFKPMGATFFENTTLSVTISVEGRESHSSPITLLQKDNIVDGYLCFEGSNLPEGWLEELNYYYCFRFTSKDTLEFYSSIYGVGPAFNEEGFLHRVSNP